MAVKATLSSLFWPNWRIDRSPAGTNSPRSRRSSVTSGTRRETLGSSGRGYPFKNGCLLVGASRNREAGNLTPSGDIRSGFDLVRPKLQKGRVMPVVGQAGFEHQVSPDETTSKWF